MTSSGTSRVAQAAWLLATLLGPAASARSSSVGGTELETRDLAAVSPEAAALVASGEQAVEAGAWKQAWGLYAHAWSLAPRSPIPSRGLCRLTLALGISNPEQRKAAAESCTRALLLGGSPEDIRNKVASLVDGSPRPTMEDLVAASVAAEGAERIGPGQLWGAAARGDLALRLGDTELLDAAVAQLHQIAPDHPQTRRLMALAVGSTRWSWIGRLVILALLVITVGHALRKQLRSRGPALSVLTIVLSLLIAGPARGAAVDDAHPESSVPSPAQQLADPLKFGDLLMELGLRAEAAVKRQDHAAAARYYGALAKAVPERSYAFGKQCDELEASGRRSEAVAACAKALTRKGTTAGDFTHFVRLLLAKSGPLTESERRQAEAAVEALEREPRAALIATRVRCNIAVHEHDLPALEACTGKLLAAQPDDAATLGFAWALAVQHGDSAAAEKLRKRAIGAGLDPAVVLGAPAIDPGLRARRWARALRWSLEAVVLFGLLVGGFSGARRLARGGRRVAVVRRGES